MRAPPRGFIGVCIPLSDPGGAAACGAALGEADLIVYPPGAELELMFMGPIRSETVFMDARRFRSITRALVGEDGFLPERFASIHHADSGSVSAIKDEIVNIQSNSSLDAESVSNLLARLVQSLADASGISCSERLANGAAARIARRARDYIEDRFRERIRLEDLCAHTGVGQRTLQRHFAAQYQLSPISYIRARRLNASRRDLVNGVPGEVMVTDIALSNGFTHLGRFSVEYRRHFGESPIQTLASGTSAPSGERS